MDFLTDLIAYPVVGLLSLLHHFALFSGSDVVTNEALDAMDSLAGGDDFVARYRYKINRMLGGSRPYVYYAAQQNQELIGCSCGCGCGCLVLLVVALVFILAVASF